MPDTTKRHEKQVDRYITIRIPSHGVFLALTRLVSVVTGTASQCFPYENWRQSTLVRLVKYNR